MDFTNLFNRKNIFLQSYNKITNEIKYTHQTGLLPVMQYRILFRNYKKDTIFYFNSSIIRLKVLLGRIAVSALVSSSK
jgi:hypothetical protein